MILSTGGQSIAQFDYGLAPAVARSFIKNLKFILSIHDMPEDTINHVADELHKKAFPDGTYSSFVSLLTPVDLEELTVDLTYYFDEVVAEDIVAKTLKKTDKDCYQAMEALIHNLNTMQSRAGAQVPFSSINYGTDTTPEGKMVIRNILLAEDAGLGDGETPIFPIHIFKVKDGINGQEGDPNYPYFELACKVSAKRLFPNFEFLDATFNAQYLKKLPNGLYDPNTEVSTMGCRTRVMGNTYDPTREVTCGRGNLSFTTVNLPRIALKHKGDIDGFFEELEEKIHLVHDQLMERLEIQSRRTVRNHPFLMGQGVWLDSDKLDIDDECGEVWKHGTLTIGFIGLAETLMVLTGKHHGEDGNAQALGLEIVGRFRELSDARSKKEKLNFSVIATPAEGLCLAGDTIVQTVNGNIPIKDVKVGDLLINLNEQTRKLEVDKVVKSGMTFKSAKVLRVTFDTGQQLVCTPNHPIAKRVVGIDHTTGRIIGENIEWVEAQNLKVGDRIRSAYIERSITGYKRYCNHKEGYLHKLLYEYYTGTKIPKGYVVHHKDENKDNNSKDNLVLMSNAEHKRHHMKDTIKPYCYTSEGTTGDKNPFYGKTHTAAAKDKISQTRRQRMEFKGDKTVPVSVFAEEYYNGSSIQDIANKYGYTYYTMRSRLLEHGVEIRANHIVTNVEWLDEEIPVYDLTMEKNHNFFVGGDHGILVHNSGRFVRMDREIYGEIPGVTDKEYYTNSYHVPVDYKITAFNKIRIEAPYHALCNGGHITYIEMDGDPLKNLDAFKAIVQAMKQMNIGYGAINHPIDYCPICGYTGVIGDECPRCGVSEGQELTHEEVDAIRKQHSARRLTSR